MNIEKKQKGYYSCFRKEMLQFIPTGCKRILEVGCGEGNFGSLLKATRKVEVHGVEITQSMAEKAKLKLDNTIVGDFENEELDIRMSYFDCVIFNDVLEHFKDPWSAIQKSNNYLINNGVIVASIPNVRFFYTMKKLIFNKEWTYTDEGVLDKTHLRFFTKDSIVEMFKICNYGLLRVEGIKPIEFPWKFKLFNWIMLQQFDDMKYERFACVAKKMKGTERKYEQF